MSTTSTTQLSAPPSRLGRPFLLLWSGQLLSMTGSMLTSFALAVWIFQRTGSIIDFTGTILFATLPALLVTPWAGSVADRLHRRTVMIASTAVAALCTAAVCVLVWSAKFQLWHLYAMLSVLSMSSAMQGPAAHAAITSIVPKEQLGRASGMLALSAAIAQISAPLMAGMLMGIIGLAGIILVDLLTYAVALAALFVIHIPSTAPDQRQAAAPKLPVLGRMLRDCGEAIAFFRQNPSMAIVFRYLAIGAFLTGMITVLITPLVLSTYSERTLALITTSGALGALVGGLAMSIWGGPPRWTVLVLAFNIVEGLCVAIAGGITSVAGLCLCAFAATLSGTMLGACVENLWRRKVPLERQGSVFALNQFVMMAALPLSAVLGGLLVHYLFEPALMPNGMWFDAVGSWFGIGKGRGTGFFFFVTGIMVAAWTLLAMTNRRLHALERDVPDAV